MTSRSQQAVAAATVSTPDGMTLSEREFHGMDKDGDGVISQEEFRASQPLFLDNETRGEKQSRDREQLNDMLRAAAMPPAQGAV